MNSAVLTFLYPSHICVQLHTTRLRMFAFMYVPRRHSIVAYRNGAYESGLFIAFNYLLEMSNCEQEIDVTQVVKQIRITRPQFIASKVNIL